MYSTRKWNVKKKKISIYTSHLRLLSLAPVVHLASHGTKDSTGQTSMLGPSWPWPGKTERKKEKRTDGQTQREIIQDKEQTENRNVETKTELWPAHSAEPGSLFGFHHWHEIEAIFQWLLKRYRGCPSRPCLCWRSCVCWKPGYSIQKDALLQNQNNFTSL